MSTQLIQAMREALTYTQDAKIAAHDVLSEHGESTSRKNIRILIKEARSAA